MTDTILLTTYEIGLGLALAEAPRNARLDLFDIPEVDPATDTARAAAAGLAARGGLGSLADGDDLAVQPEVAVSIEALATSTRMVTVVVGATEAAAAYRYLESPVATLLVRTVGTDLLAITGLATDASIEDHIVGGVLEVMRSDMTTPRILLGAAGEPDGAGLAVTAREGSWHIASTSGDERTVASVDELEDVLRELVPALLRPAVDSG